MPDDLHVSTPPVEGAAPAQWRVRWATTGSEDVCAVAAVMIDGHPRAVTGSRGGLVRVWDLTTGQPLGEPLNADLAEFAELAPVAEVTGVMVDGRPHAITGSWHGLVEVWELTTGLPVGEPLKVDTGQVETVAGLVIDDHLHGITGDSSDTVQVWDLITGERVGEPLDGRTGWVRAVEVVLVDGRSHVIAGGDDGVAWVWDLSTGRPVGGPLAGHTAGVRAVSATVVDGRPVVVTGGEDGAVRVWDPTNGRLVGEPRVGRDDQVWAVTTVMIDGRPHAVTGGTRRTRGHWAGQVEMWDLTTHQQGGPQTAFPEPVHAVAVMPDGRLVVHFGREMAVLVRC